MHDEGHGMPGQASGPEGHLHGPGPGFHTDPDDHLVGNVLHRNRPEGHETGLRGARYGEEEEAEILLFSKITLQLFRDSENSLNIASQLTRTTWDTHQTIRKGT